MAVAPTGDIFKALSFDNVSSRTYGVYITGEAVYNAPERDVEMVEIPGRNGSFALDKGRFQNIEVSYPAGIFADNETDFAEAISDFRNFLCSRKGYVRLTDEYNPSEYRMAIYKSGLEVSPAQLKAGEFEIVFDCKPQRWLTSGETEVTVSSGGTLTNPTLFESSPIIKVEGYGTISTGGQSIDVESVPVGNVFLSNGATNSEVYPNSTNHYIAEVAKLNLDLSNLNTGDSFVLAPTTFTYDYTTSGSGDSFTVATATNQVSPGSTTASIINQKTAIFRTTFEPLTFVKGTARTVNHTYDKHWEMSGGSTLSASETIRVFYNGSNTIRLMASEGESGGLNYTATGIGQLGSVSGYSTVLVSGEITIDLDIGEAYWENNGSVASANFAVSLGSELMKLKAGANTIAYSNTFTSCKIIPRWWRV